MDLLDSNVKTLLSFNVDIVVPTQESNKNSVSFVFFYVCLLILNLSLCKKLPVQCLFRHLCLHADHQDAIFIHHILLILTL